MFEIQQDGNIMVEIKKHPLKMPLHLIITLLQENDNSLCYFQIFKSEGSANLGMQTLKKIVFELAKTL